MSFPITRVKTIMKSTAGVDTVSKESTQVLAHAAEMFIKKIAQQAVGPAAKRKKTLEYADISGLIAREQQYYFIREIIPNKISFKKYRALMLQQGTPLLLEPSSSEEESSSDDDVVEVKMEESQPSTSKQAEESPFKKPAPVPRLVSRPFPPQ